MQKIIPIFFLLLLANFVNGQQLYWNYNSMGALPLTAHLLTDTQRVHANVKPLATWNYAMGADSLNRIWYGAKRPKSKWLNKISYDHLLNVSDDDFKMVADPIFNFNYTQFEKNNYYLNTRGVQVQGSYKNKFYFYSGLLENQARFLPYIQQQVSQHQIAPGQGVVKFFDDFVDFNSSYGGIAYKLDKHFDFHLTYDKNFIGQGYRSLLLSDNSFNYPMLKLNMEFWKFKYTVIYTLMQDLKSAAVDNVGFRRKYGTFHYLDLILGKKNNFSIGLFDAVIWKHNASRGFDPTYLNPVVLLRPLENSLDSPDNTLLGLNLTYKPFKGLMAYGQIMFDELIVKEVRAGNGWWGNKQAYQLGLQAFKNIHGLNLNFRTEFNLVRPFTYGHRSTLQNYAHYNQALAHPLGSNFMELINHLNVSYKRFTFAASFQSITNASDEVGKVQGNDIFDNYELRESEYGVFMYNGIKNRFKSSEVRIGYMINPATNFKIDLSIRKRGNDTLIIGCSLLHALYNHYYDF